MMETAHLWQNIVVTVAAIAAAAWLVKDRIRHRREKTACARCALAQAPARTVSAHEDDLDRLNARS